MIANRKTKTRLLAALMGAGLLTLVPDASALCRRVVGTDDQHLANALGCDPAVFRAVAREYRMSSTVWSNRGWDDACNPTKEFPKLWRAMYLAWYGVDWQRAWFADGAQVFSRAFHSSVRDYGPATHGMGKVRGLGRYHSGYDTHIQDVCADCDVSYAAAVYQRRGVRANRVILTCQVFEGPTWATSADRAGVLFHEAWHAHNHTGPEGASWYAGHGCWLETHEGREWDGTRDTYYPVFKGSYPKEKLWRSRVYGAMRSYQAQHRMMCDMADWPSPWVPGSVSRAADIRAARLARQKLEPIPPFNCGTVQPYGSDSDSAVDPYTRTMWNEHGRCGAGGIECMSQNDCAGDSFCEIADGQTVGCCIAVVY